MEPYRVILADPPWQFRLYSKRGEKKAPQRHYECLTLADIKALPVGAVSDRRGSVLFLWATNPMLPAAFDVIAAWGFTYCTKVEWVKLTKDRSRPRIGTGYRVRSSTEPLLIATRGDELYCPPGSDRLPGVIMAPRGRHSAKPPEQWPYLEQYPGPRLEMFARHVRPGWECLGNEIDGRDIRASLGEIAQRLSPQLALDLDACEAAKPLRMRTILK